MKPAIIERLGQAQLLLPNLVAKGLDANERAKLRLSTLQAAARHAREPGGARFNLGDECKVAGIDPVAMEALVDQASLSAGERLTAPGLCNIGEAIWGDVATMIRAVKAGNPAGGDEAEQRLSNIRGSVSLGTSDEIELREVAQVTSVSQAQADSLHRLVMDLHKTLNQLATAHAEETLAGAHVSGLRPQDRPAVEAFMRGVAATEKLKFGHPGLATTATRTGQGLLIQNDIGETEAHVVVVHVEPDAVKITYTDVHLPRAKFFVSLLRDFHIEWGGLERKSTAGIGEDDAFYFVSGRFPYADAAERDQFLERLGASMVFQIDWNKARKSLRQLVSNNDAIKVLTWAAQNNVGHRGFLELGGTELVSAAVRHAAPTRIGFGERLDCALGRDAALEFLKTVLSVSAELLLQGSSVRLARDRIEAALVMHLQRVDTTLLTAVIRQAGLARDIASGIARFIAERQAPNPADGAELADRARHIEEKADRIVIETRSEIVRVGADPNLERLVTEIENAIDELEQAAFLASLVRLEVPSELLEPLAELCAAAVAGTEAAAVAVAAAGEIPAGHHADTEDTLAAVGRLIDVEHKADAAERKMTASIMTGEYTVKSALPVLELARAIERSTDRLAAFGRLLHEHVLADLAA